jgi:hypothetical protein
MRSRRILLLALTMLFGCERRPKPARLQGFDALIPPGATATLRAKLERKGVLGIHPDLHGKPLEFRLGENVVGKAKTGRDGMATLAWTPPGKEPATYECRVALPAGSGYAAPPALLLVFVRDPGHPALVVDLDDTICAGSALAVATKDPGRIPVVEGSVAAVNALARHYDVIYLTARDDALVARSRAWLDLKRFPRGPLLVRDIGLLTLSAKRYKRARLKELRKTFHLVAGVGDRTEDAEAYLAAGMRALLVGEDRKTPEGAERFATWAEIEKALTP